MSLPTKGDDGRRRGKSVSERRGIPDLIVGRRRVGLLKSEMPSSALPVAGQVFGGIGIKGSCRDHRPLAGHKDEVAPDRRAGRRRRRRARACQRISPGRRERGQVVAGGVLMPVFVLARMRGSRGNEVRHELKVLRGRGGEVRDSRRRAAAIGAIAAWPDSVTDRPADVQPAGDDLPRAVLRDWKPPAWCRRSIDKHIVEQGCRRPAVSPTVGEPRVRMSSNDSRNGWDRSGWRRYGPLTVAPRWAAAGGRAGSGYVTDTAGKFWHRCLPPRADRRCPRTGAVFPCRKATTFPPSGRYRTSYCRSWSAEVSDSGTSQYAAMFGETTWPTA